MTFRQSPQLNLLTGRPAARERVREQTIQSGAVRGYQAHGYIVLQTNEHRRPARCPSCGHWHIPLGGNGRDSGVPDLLISHLAWPASIWQGIEMKGSHTRLSPAQQLLRAQQRIAVARGFDEAWDVTQEFESWRQCQPADRSGEIAELTTALLEVKQRLQVLISERSATCLELRALKLRVDRALRGERLEV